MFDKVLNEPLVFYGIAILSQLLKAFCKKIAGCVPTSLRELCHRRLFGNSPIFFRIATFQNFGRLLQIPPEIISVSAFLVQFLLKSTFTAQVLLMFFGIL